MARSKNRVLGIEDSDGKYIKAQLQGVVIAARPRCS